MDRNLVDLYIISVDSSAQEASGIAVEIAEREY